MQDLENGPIGWMIVLSDAPRELAQRGVIVDVVHFGQVKGFLSCDRHHVRSFGKSLASSMRGNNRQGKMFHLYKKNFA